MKDSQSVVEALRGDEFATISLASPLQFNANGLEADTIKAVADRSLHLVLESAVVIRNLFAIVLSPLLRRCRSGIGLASRCLPKVGSMAYPTTSHDEFA